MILLEKAETYGWETAIQGMRNPMNSWDKSDSQYYTRIENGNVVYGYTIGENDLSLMKKLAVTGNDHGKFLRMIIVAVDITAPLYWWKEFDTYKVGTVANSCSTMHKIHAKEFTHEDFSCEHLMDSSQDLKDADLPFDSYGYSIQDVLNITIAVLNYARMKFLETHDKKWWWQMIQLLPSSYNQKRTVQLNYAVLKNIYHARKAHKLDEWRTFCFWIEMLPYSELITGDTIK